MRLTQQLHPRPQAGGTRVMLSVGGWNARPLFKSFFETPAMAAALTQAIADTVSHLGLDGVDMDIECGDLVSDHATALPPSTGALVGWFRGMRQALTLLQASSGRAQPYLLTFTVMTPSALFDEWVQATASTVDYFQLMAYNPYIDPSHPGREWPFPVKCDPKAVDPKPYVVWWRVAGVSWVAGWLAGWLRTCTRVAAVRGQARREQAVPRRALRCAL
jgi:hypothetical protein